MKNDRLKKLSQRGLSSRKEQANGKTDQEDANANGRMNLFIADQLLTRLSDFIHSCLGYIWRDTLQGLLGGAWIRFILYGRMLIFICALDSGKPQAGWMRIFRMSYSARGGL